MKKLFKSILNIFKKKDYCYLECPNCKNDQWIEGPGGGSFGNIQCSKCNKKYNHLGIFGLQEIN